jgi:hypothetical protein
LHRVGSSCFEFWEGNCPQENAMKILSLKCVAAY